MSTPLHASGRLFRVAFGLTLANVIVTVVNTLIGLCTARLLPAYEYGQVAYFMSMYLIVMLVAGLGLTDQIMRDVAELRSLDQSARLGRAFYSLLLLRLMTSLVLMAVLAAYALVVQQWTPLLIGVAAAWSMVFDFLTGVLRGVQRIGALIVVLCLQPVTYLGAILAFQPTAADQIFVLFCASFGLVAVVAALALRGCGIGAPRLSSISQAYLRTSSGGAAQLYSVTLLQLAYSSIGTLVLGAMGRYEAAGVVSVGLTIVRMLPLMLGSTITSVYYPQLRVDLTGRATDAATPTFRVFYDTTLSIALGGTALLIVFPDAAVRTLYTAKYMAAVPMVQLLAPLCVLLVVDLLLTWTLIAHNRATRAIVILAVRLGVFLAGASTVIALVPVTLPTAIALAYVGASVTGAGLQLHAVGQFRLYRLAAWRVVLVGCAAIISAAGCRWLLPDLPLGAIRYFGNSICAALVYAALIVIVFYRPFLPLAVQSAFRVRVLRARS